MLVVIQAHAIRKANSFKKVLEGVTCFDPSLIGAGNKFIKVQVICINDTIHITLNWFHILFEKAMIETTKDL